MEKTYDEYKGLIDKHLLDLLPAVDSKSNTLYEAMKYSLSSGGKRLRPVLLLSCCDFAGGNVMEALPYAAAIEYIHTYSLIHIVLRPPRSTLAVDEEVDELLLMQATYYHVDIVRDGL